MPDKFIDCIITSPPYWQLRDYGYAEQWGLEPTFELYLEHLWSMMDECYRVLKDGGTAWINLGDTYSTQSGTNIAIANGRHKEYDSTHLTNRGESELLIKGKQSIPNKCLMLLPHRFAIGCIDRGWIVRNDIVWAKRNGMPESVTDRLSKKHEYFFFMVKSEKYFFDLDSIRDKHISKIHKPGNNNAKERTAGVNDRGGASQWDDTKERSWGNELGKNPGSVSDFWNIPTKPSSKEHYASYNDSLLVKPILAGCPEGGIIYDPFMGTGSTAECAIRSNRKFIGSEMGKTYFDNCEKNINLILSQSKLF